MKEFLDAVIRVSEKAANIARECRAEKALFELLVEEKTGDQKNKRFLQDFKTLADVLIQETVKHDLGRQFPEIADHIFGEESNKFTNTLGETIAVEVKETEQETCDLLKQVLDGNNEAARLLGEAVHQDITMETDTVDVNVSLSLQDLAIWIDPIDSTAEYISGTEKESIGGIFPKGLQCVTILIGIFHRVTGEPIIGVINQPFHKFNSSTASWQGRYLWGVACGDIKVYSPDLQLTHPSKTTVVMSPTESELIVKALSHCTIFNAAGAGYKQLCVIDGFADVYILAKPSTFKWDSCAPHAILRSLGGGLVDFKAVVSECKQFESSQIMYSISNSEHSGIDQWCNLGGIVAYTDEAKARSVVEHLQKINYPC